MINNELYTDSILNLYSPHRTFVLESLLESFVYIASPILSILTTVSLSPILKKMLLSQHNILALKKLLNYKLTLLVASSC